VNGETIFRKRVGPAAPHPFMAPAQEDLEQRAARILEDKLSEW
jgi:hypothetical protein